MEEKIFCCTGIVLVVYPFGERINKIKSVTDCFMKFNVDNNMMLLTYSFYEILIYKLCIWNICYRLLYNPAKLIILIL